MSLSEEIESLYQHELSLAGRSAQQYALLRLVQQKSLPVGNFPSYAFFNPGRISSVMADISPEVIAKRQCFLCPEGLEEKQQTLEWQNTTIKHIHTTEIDGRYCIRVNPFPIYYHHYTISYHEHVRQEMYGHFSDMLALAGELSGHYTVFYNGPKCGASAPDHMHFQAIPTGRLPMQQIIEQNDPANFDIIRRTNNLIIKRVKLYCKGAILIKSEYADQMKYAFYEVVQCAKTRPGEYEPRMNVVTWHDGIYYKTLVFFRNESRPSCFFSEDPEERILISPGAVEMAGVAIVSNQDSYYKLTADRLAQIMDEVSLDVKVY